MSPSTRQMLFKHFLIFCGEFLATAFLMIFGCMGMIGKDTMTQAALAWAFTVTAVITSFGHLTGSHINPCVTICFVILGFIGPLTALVYFVAELLGAIFGFYLVLVLTQSWMITNTTDPDAAFCLTSIDSGVSVQHGFLCEFIATSLLIFAVCSVTDRRNTFRGDATAIKIGFVVAILVYGVGPLTGASLNPARSFAPALLYRKWKHQWVYWASTLCAAICTSLVYKFLFSASVEDEVITRTVKPTASADGLKQSMLVDANNPKIGATRIKSSEVSSQLKTDIAIQKDATFASNS